MNNTEISFWKTLGPGILFAGAAIGTSHLVQSTRAGAVYGLGLLAVIIFANLIKYPAYRFGPHYAAVTGKSLIEGYRALGRWVVALIGLIELPVITIVIAATAITTSAIFLAVFELDWNVRYVGCAFIVFAGLVLSFGSFKLLDILTKIFVAILTICTVVATIIALPNVEWNFIPNSSDFNFKTFSFMIALMGFMPAALDLSIMHSLWSVEKSKSSKQPIALKAVLTDLNVGYIITTLLAVFFLLMGASVMHSVGTAPATTAPAFANQIIKLYTVTLGEWSGWVVGIAALLVMFTTLMTVLDGMPRLLSGVIDSLAPKTESIKESRTRSPYLPYVTGFVSIAAMIILLFLMKSFTSFIDFVTITSFLVAPIIALLNHRVVFGNTVAEQDKPGNKLRIWSLIGIVFLGLLSVAYCYMLFFNP